MTPTKAIEKFFEKYEARFNNALATPPKDDVEGTVSSFADFFVEASPVGVHGSKNDDTFRKMIPQGNAFYRKIGTTSMKIKGIDVVPLNDRHVAAKVAWDSRYKKDGKEIDIPFEVIYLLQVNDDTPKIFAYITGDEQRALREKGLVA